MLCSTFHSEFGTFIAVKSLKFAAKVLQKNAVCWSSITKNDFNI